MVIFQEYFQEEEMKKSTQMPTVHIVALDFTQQARLQTKAR